MMKESYLNIADKNLPELNKEIITPEVPLQILDSGDEIIIDLRNHYVGYFSFILGSADTYIDAPVRLSTKFCETANELEYNFEECDGSICESWLQEEIINIDFPEE